MPVESMRGFGQGLEAGTDGEQFAADGARVRIGSPGVHEHADEIGKQQDVGIEGQDPLRAAGADGLVLGLGKTHVAGG